MIRYSIQINWSDEDQVYIVTLPEFHGSLTHGDTYEEAVKNAQEVLELLIEVYQEDGKPLPAIHRFEDLEEQPQEEQTLSLLAQETA
jgi:predicted RNase H-like HicB family nuclease